MANATVTGISHCKKQNKFSFGPLASFSVELGNRSRWVQCLGDGINSGGTVRGFTPKWLSAILCSWPNTDSKQQLGAFLDLLANYDFVLL